MINLTRAEVRNLISHKVGNKGIGEELILNEAEIKLTDDFTVTTVFQYLTSSFKPGRYFKFKSKNELNYHDVKSYCEDIFRDPELFVEKSSRIADHLYNQSMHPKIKGGEFTVAYFKDCAVDGVICDAIGLFKTETKETFLRLDADESRIEVENGVSLKKLDKGCLIFNTDPEDGYKIALVDNNNKIADAYFYWSEDFLNTKVKEDAYYHTENLILTMVAFVEEVMAQADFRKEIQAEVLCNTIKYMVDHEAFVMSEFGDTVTAPKALKTQFVEFRKEWGNKMDINVPDKFEVSPLAVKNNSKYANMKLKLDKNFELTVKGGHSRIENGYDDQSGLKFIKLFYTNQD